MCESPLQCVQNFFSHFALVGGKGYASSYNLAKYATEMYFRLNLIETKGLILLLIFPVLVLVIVLLQCLPSSSVQMHYD